MASVSDLLAGSGSAFSPSFPDPDPDNFFFFFKSVFKIPWKTIHFDKIMFYEPTNKLFIAFGIKNDPVDDQ